MSQFKSHTKMQAIILIVRIAIQYMVLMVIKVIVKDPLMALLWSLVSTILVDPVDSTIGKATYGSGYTMTRDYQYWDKLGDIIIYGAILTMYIDRVPTYLAIMMALTYLWRFIGTILFIVTGNKWYLILFPNLYVEPIIIAILLTRYTRVPNTLYWVVIGMGMVLKVGYEYLHHILWDKGPYLGDGIIGVGLV